MFYRKVSVRVWRDAKFRALPDDSKFLWLALLTSPDCTNVGLIPARVEGVAVEIEWTPDRTHRAMQPIADSGMAEVDNDVGVIALPAWFKHNAPENPKAAAGQFNRFAEMPDSGLVPRQFQRLCECVGRCFGHLDKSTDKKDRVSADIIDRARKSAEESLPGKGIDTLSKPYRYIDPDPEPALEPEQQQDAREAAGVAV